MSTLYALQDAAESLAIAHNLTASAALADALRPLDRLGAILDEIRRPDTLLAALDPETTTPAAAAVLVASHVLAVPGHPAEASLRRTLEDVLAPAVTSAARAYGREAHAILRQRFNAAAAKLGPLVAKVPQGLTTEAALRASAGVRSAFLAMDETLAELADAAQGLADAYALATPRPARPAVALPFLVLDREEIPLDRLRRGHALAEARDWEALAREDYPLKARPLDAIGTPAELPPIHLHQIGNRAAPAEYDTLTGTYHKEPALEAARVKALRARDARDSRDARLHAGGVLL